MHLHMRLKQHSSRGRQARSRAQERVFPDLAQTLGQAVAGNILYGVSWLATCLSIGTNLRKQMLAKLKCV